jgi:hypothetical protein
MQIRSRLVRYGAVAAVAALAVGCGGRWLRWKAKPAASTMVGKADITVADHREPKKGGMDPRHVGNERNGWGVPFAIRLRSPTEAAESIRDFIGQAAMSSGVGVAAPGEPVTGRIAVEIQQLWCDGYPPVYKANMVAAITVVGPDNSPRMPAVPLVAEGGHMGCQWAYQNMLTKAYDQAMALMSQQGFKDAVAGAGAAPPPAPTPPPAQ